MNWRREPPQKIQIASLNRAERQLPARIVSPYISAWVTKEEGGGVVLSTLRYGINYSDAAYVFYENGEYKIRNDTIGLSRKPVLLNGEPLPEVSLLKDGDFISIGRGENFIFQENPVQDFLDDPDTAQIEPPEIYVSQKCKTNITINLDGISLKADAPIVRWEKIECISIKEAYPNRYRICLEHRGTAETTKLDLVISENDVKNFLIWLTHSAPCHLSIFAPPFWKNDVYEIVARTKIIEPVRLGKKDFPYSEQFMFFQGLQSKKYEDIGNGITLLILWPLIPLWVNSWRNEPLRESIGGFLLLLLSLYLIPAFFCLYRGVRQLIPSR